MLVTVVCGAPLCRWLTADHWEKATITSGPLWSDPDVPKASLLSDKFLMTTKFKYNLGEQMLSPDNCTYPFATAARNLS